MGRPLLPSEGAEGNDGGEKEWERLSLAPVMATLLLPIIIGAVLVLKCVFGHCCARKTRTKEEFYGIEGRMTMLNNSDLAYLTAPPLTGGSSTQTSIITNPVLGNNGLMSPACNAENAEDAIDASNKPSTSNSHHDVVVVVGREREHASKSDFGLPNRNENENSDSLKRSAGKRQLPDLPEIPHNSSVGPPRRTSSVLSHDGTSELYATVGECPNPYDQIKSNRGDHGATTSQGRNHQSGGGRGSSGGNLEPNPSSDSETYTTNHPYAKLKRNSAEHPYARVRRGSSVNDEETDTDNYDMPQPYAHTRRSGTESNQGNAANDSAADGAGPSHGPVPPRRVGRNFRRESQPQGQNSVDSASHFSGDSQDSRGYTSISVREPLSNIRNNVATRGRSVDNSHYATMSDDSEEMYAAIDDPSDGNYMQIPEGGQRPWIGANGSMASPIPERREANSPLPPVPLVPPPDNAGSLSPNQSTAPVYAQVTKPKKGKAPAAPTISNASSSSHTTGRESESLHVDSPLPGPSTSTSQQPNNHNHSQHHSHSHHHRHHRRSKSRTLMDNNNLLEGSERRWSKADISYSEFEVVRESYIPPVAETKASVPLASSTDSLPPPPCRDHDSNRNPPSFPRELVDEDNYNVIPDRHNRNRTDSENYQEIEPISNTYQEIGGKEPSDHYQEIGAAIRSRQEEEDDQDSGSGLYQEIRKKDEDIDDEEEDQFYETVKPSREQSTDKKHGYEKITKNKSVAGITDKTSDDDDEDQEDQMYEKMRYPPYERLKESRSDLAVDRNDDSDARENNHYEHVGYSRVKPKRKPNQLVTVNIHSNHVSADHDDQVDVNQLYAVVDKTKKNKTSNRTSASVTTSSLPINDGSHNNHNNNFVIDNNFTSTTSSSGFSSGNHGETKTYSPGSGRNRDHSLHKGVRGDFSDLDYIDENIDIEYI